MAVRSNEFVDSLVETLKANGRLLTIFAVSAIIIGGITLVEYPENWWISLAAVVGFFLVIFVFINARVLIKSIVATALTLVLAGVAFNLGAASEPYGPGAFVWLFGHFIVYFLSLALSYFLPSGQSRWTSIGLAVTLYFGLTWALAAELGTLVAPAAVSILIAVGFFVLIYLYGGQTRFSPKKMPEPFSSDNLTKNIEKSAEFSGFEVRPIVTKEDTSFLVWGERAYVLYPVKLEQALGIIGKKKSVRLSYKGKSINEWLRYLSFTKNPHFKARGAETMLVLLDMNNTNGKDFKVIGVSMPDTKAITPVGIMPGKLLLANEDAALKKALAHFDSFYQGYVTDLNEKQKVALTRFGAPKVEETPVA